MSSAIAIWKSAASVTIWVSGAAPNICAICTRFHCERDTVGCVQCGQEYCSDCVNSMGLCATCAAVDVAGVAVDRRALAWGAHEQAQAVVPHYHWVVIGEQLAL